MEADSPLDWTTAILAGLGVIVPLALAIAGNWRRQRCRLSISASHLNEGLISFSVEYRPESPGAECHALMRVVEPKTAMLLPTDAAPTPETQGSDNQTMNLEWRSKSEIFASMKRVVNDASLLFTGGVIGPAPQSCRLRVEIRDSSSQRRIAGPRIFHIDPVPSATQRKLTKSDA